MNFFTDDRAGELRELFFESAQDLLQELNEAGLELEANPGDAEVVRRVRRVVHTLKGDSAACGFRELSSLAHEMEDALAPEAGQAPAGSLVEVIFTAADTFQALLAAYRKGLEPPPGDALRAHIRRMAGKPASQPVVESPATVFAARFDWTETERAGIDEALAQGHRVYNIALCIDPASQMRAAAFELIRKVLDGAGTILAMRPADATAAQSIRQMEAALASDQPKDALAKKCQIPSAVIGIVVEEVSDGVAGAQDLLGVLLEAEAKAAVAGPAAPAPAKALPPLREPEGQRHSASRASAAENTLRVDAARIDTVMNLIGEMIIGKSMLHRTIVEFDRLHSKDPLRGRFADALAFQSRVLNELQRSVMKIRMVPVEQLFRRFPRVVRDVAKLRGRDVSCETVGENTDLDKSILDALAEPLAHLVRNAVDHGIEPPEERIAAGKPARGAVRLNAYHRGNQVVIEVSDDGRGIDRRKLARRAVERGLLAASEAEKLSESDALQLIFHPGLSTADEVTQISGRGVGMDVVAGALERLKGNVEVESRPGAGTVFRLIVPLTLASIQALLFRAAGRLYAVPLSNVLEITRAADAEIHRVENYDVFRLRDQILTLVHLDRLAPHLADAARKKSFVVVMGAGEKKFGMVVDGLMGEEELVIKALDDRLAASDLVSGASILGDGTVVLILNIAAVAARLARMPALGAIA